MAIGAVILIGTTVQSLYVSSRPDAIQFTPLSLLTGSALGIGVSLFAALAPAVEASRVSPVEAMARGREQYNASIAIPHHRHLCDGPFALVRCLLSYSRPSTASRFLRILRFCCSSVERRSSCRTWSHCLLVSQPRRFKRCWGGGTPRHALVAGFSCAALPSYYCSRDCRRHDGQRRHHGGQFPRDRLAVDGKPVASRLLSAPCGLRGRRSLPHHVRRSGGRHRPDSRRRLRRSLSRLPDGLRRHAGYARSWRERRRHSVSCLAKTTTQSFANCPQATSPLSASHSPTSIICAWAAPLISLSAAAAGVSKFLASITITLPNAATSCLTARRF